MNTLAPLPGPLSVAPHARQSSGRAAARHEQPCKAFSSGVASPEPANRMPGRTRPPDPDSTAISFPSLPSPSPLPHLPEAESWAAPNPDCTPVDAAFALELRAESIEHLCGGDALRRGEIERIEAGGSDNDADLVAGRDRVQVQGTLAEHTGHGLAVQAAHLATSVGGAFGTCASKEDTMLLAGHMRDTWDGGTAVVAAMSDDLAAGGGVRATAPLDVWAHGLMGLEERPGTCTADGVLAEACGTLYEREYRSAVHAAGVAVFNGTLYQSARNSFRPLMRVSMGVRNLIAAGGGGAGGDVPSVSPPPAGAAGGEQGADAAAGTLAAGRGAAETPQSAQEAARLDVTEVLAREAGEAGAVADPVDVSELRRDADTAERLGGLRDALRGTGAEDETASGARTSETGVIASGSLAADPPGFLDGRPAAVALDPEPPSPQVGGGQVQGPMPKLGLLGGDPGDAPAPPPGDFDWAPSYRLLRERRRVYVRSLNWPAVDAYNRALSFIDFKVMRSYAGLGGHAGDLVRRPAGVTAAEQAYGALNTAHLQSIRADDWDLSARLGRALGEIDEITFEQTSTLAGRLSEFSGSSMMQNTRLHPGWDVSRFEEWIGTQYLDGMHAMESAKSRNDTVASAAANNDVQFFSRARYDLQQGRNPLIDSYNRIRYWTETGNVSAARELVSKHSVLENAMANLVAFRRMSNLREVSGLPAGPAILAHMVSAWPPELPGGLLRTVDVPGPSRHVPVEIAPSRVEPPGRLGQTADVSGPFSQVALEDNPFFQELSGGIPTEIAPSRVEPPGMLGQAADVSGSSSQVALEDNPFFQELSGGMPEWHVVGPGGSNRADAIAGGAPHVHEVDAVVAPQLVTDSTLWTRPTQSVGTPATVQFDSGLQRAGTNGRPRIDSSGPGATGGAVGSSNTGVGTVAHGGGSIDSTAPWVEDDFAVERALNAGRLPADFDASGLIGEWGWLARNTAIDGQLESGLLPARTIESMVERYRAMDPPGGYDLLIGQLEAMKAAITRALADAYGYRADPIWLARVDDALQAHRGTEAADADALRQMDEVIHYLEIAPGSLPPPVSRASVVDGFGFEVGGGALSPAGDAWRGGESPGHVSFGHTEVVTSRSTEPPFVPAGGRRVTSAIAPQEWSSGATPGFRRLSSAVGEMHFSRREQIVHRLLTSESLSHAQVSQLSRRIDQGIAAGEIGSSDSRWRLGLQHDLLRLGGVAQESVPAAVALEDVDWSEIDALLRWLDHLDHPA